MMMMTTDTLNQRITAAKKARDEAEDALIAANERLHEAKEAFTEMERQFVLANEKYVMLLETVLALRGAETP